MPRSNGQPTGTTTDREARLQLVLDDARCCVNSAAEKLRQALLIAHAGPRTSQELTWRLQGVTTLQDLMLQAKRIELLAQSREDVADVQS